VSRQREYLADAAAVQFTRNPSGLADALKKIGGLMTGSIISHPRVSEISHMYFSDGVGASMATHPPLKDRIKRLDPHFRGAFPKVEPLPAPGLPGVERKKRTGDSKGKSAKEKSKGGFHPVITGAAAAAILGTVGAPMKAHVETAKGLIDELPDVLRRSILESPGARALIYALLLDADDDIRARQIQAIKEREAELIIRETEKLWGFRGALPPRARLPLVDLAMPALRSLRRHEYDNFKWCVKKLVMTDGALSFFEYVLSHLVIRRLDDRFSKPRRKAVQIYRVRGAETECSVVLTFLARFGSRDEKSAAGAFGAGEKILREPRTELEFLSLNDYSVMDLEAALDRLALTSPLVKKKLLAACLKCITFDREITAEEVELFRVIAESLDCPVPPWVTASSPSQKTQ
ncbi:MAG TPA: M48 family metalloprotease, partial [Nitrospiria bacterium]